MDGFWLILIVALVVVAALALFARSTKSSDVSSDNLKRLPAGNNKPSHSHIPKLSREEARKWLDNFLVRQQK